MSLFSGVLYGSSGSAYSTSCLPFTKISTRFPATLALTSAHSPSFAMRFTIFLTPRRLPVLRHHALESRELSMAIL